jgi:uncharacterized membrane protein
VQVGRLARRGAFGFVQPPVTFTNPWALALLLIVPYTIWLSRCSLADLSRWRRRVTTALRVLIVALLVGALAGAQVAQRKTGMCVLFVLDQSDSITPEQKQAELEYVKKACQRMPSGDTAGMIAFGTEAFVEKAPQPRLSVPEVHSAVGTTYTDLAAATRLALAAFPEEALKRVVLISDGNETLGNAVEEAKIAASNDVAVDTVPLVTERQKEVVVEKLDVPPSAKVGEPFQAKLIIKAHNNTKARVRLYRNDQYLGEQQVTLVQGTNRFEFPQQLKAAGAYTYDAVLECKDDTIAENNRGLGCVLVRGQPKILYVEGDPGESGPLARNLAAEKIETAVVGPSGLPTNLAELQNYDALILSDTPEMVMSEQQEKMIRAAVRNLGIGFIMIGGEDSFGVGGFFRTPIEDCLPVYMDVRKKKQYPSLAIECVLDKSGSMSETGAGGYTKCDLAKAAAAEVVGLLNANDWVGVIDFDEAYKETVALRRCDDKRAIQNLIGTIQPGGGTQMYGPMERAYNRLKACDARLKHCILLTDGQSLPADFDGLARQMYSDGVTISSVAIGSDSAFDLLKRIAQIGHGNYYYTDDPRHIPRIFTREAMLASKALLIEEEFYPVQKAESQILKGLAAGGFPPLLGYVATTPKELAKVPLVSHQGDPVLAEWRYGLGRSLAWTSDAKRRWAAHWLSWPGYGKFWSQAVRSVIRSAITADFQTSVEINQGVATITADAVTDEGEFINFLHPKAHIVLPDMGAKEVDLEQAAPGKYQATFDARDVGTYWVNVSYERPDHQLAQQAAGITVPYPPEYADVGSNQFLLAQLSETTGGQFQAPPENTFQRRPHAAVKRREVWPFLSLLALLLFPLDIALRRLMIEREHLAAFAEKAREWVPHRTPKESLAIHSRLRDVVRRTGIDLLVVGGHGHRGFRDWLYGETITSVRHGLNVPVFAVRE